MWSRAAGPWSGSAPDGCRKSGRRPGRLAIGRRPLARCGGRPPHRVALGPVQPGGRGTAVPGHPGHPDQHGRGPMREHRYSIELPHCPARLWALMQDYDRWADYAPMVSGVEVGYPGDVNGNGLLRRGIYKMPLGRKGPALELVRGLSPGQAYSYTILSKGAG